MIKRNRMLVMIFGGIVLSASVCGAKDLANTMKYDAEKQTMMKDGTSLTFKLTHANAGEMKVRITITNMSSQIMMLDRDAILVKLPDGKMIKRLGMKKDFLVINPGKAEDISVNFGEKGRDMRTVEKAALVVGGVSFANDPKARVVGELALTQNGPAD